MSGPAEQPREFYQRYVEEHVTLSPQSTWFEALDSLRPPVLALSRVALLGTVGAAWLSTA